MSNEIDAKQLIYEVRIRPALWDLKHVHNKSYKTVGKQWKEVATALGVEDVRRSEIRKQTDKNMGVYDPQIDYDSKWIYYKDLHFIRDNKRKRRSRRELNAEQNDGLQNDLNESQLNDVSEIKIEPTQIAEDGIYSAEEFTDYHDDNETDEHYDGIEIEDDDEDDFDNLDILPEEFQSISLPEQEFRDIPTSRPLIPDPREHTNMTDINVGTTKNPTTHQTTSANNNSTTKNCKCGSRSEQNVHFLENLEQEEHNLMKSTQDDMKRATNHIGDSDYNFLVSFLPQMKKMNDFQNLQFRARMSDLMLNILVPTTAGHVSNTRMSIAEHNYLYNHEMNENNNTVLNAATSTSSNYFS
ncbi:uncharacterized protein LOC133326997 [Musca vetustissima]|uniref:uncharacterized protein LOC133326997 n=1 Tax=Musca vetustissima TaxID=27455 RepID=UPI002AB78BB3|nr:uncharacterized protein LOC133326997 [Musca vetustissima]